MREHLRFLILLGLGAVSVSCQPSGGGSGPGSDDSKLRADGAARQCGTTSCAVGSVCCNASCGICTPPGHACIQLACDPADQGKTCADLHCDAGETCMETRGGAQCVAQEENPCNLADCAPNASCKVEQGGAICVPATPSQDAATGPVDAGPVVRSDAGSPKPSSCAVTLCPVNTYCDDITGEAKCIKAPSCDGTRCDAGQHCELQPVQCIRAPCPAQPTCVPDGKDVCATVRCAAGTHCEAQQVQCIRAPCPPIAECVPDGVGTKCGKNTCEAGMFCCNASCGTCAPKNGACTQVFCPPEP